MITIYLIRNKINEKVYIGQTKKPLNRRLSEHKSCARNSAHNCYKLENAINKYGEENFFIESIMDTNTQNDANEAEIFYIEKYDSIRAGYNIQSGGHGNRDIRGARNPRAKLTENQMEEILRMATNKEKSQLEIAKQFGIHRTTVQRILHNKSWVSPNRDNVNVQKKLSIDDIKGIKNLLKIAKLSYKDIANKYNVSKSMIAHISKGRLYSEV